MQHRFAADRATLVFCSAMIVSIFVIYMSTGWDISSMSHFDYPFGADVPIYLSEGTDRTYHWLIRAFLRAYRSFVGFLGFDGSRLTTKLPFAVFGVANVIVSIASFSLLFGRLSVRSVLYGMCCGLALIVWFYASTPESYILSTLLYSLYFMIFIRIAILGPTTRLGISLAVVFFLALANDLSALTLAVAPVAYYALDIARDAALRRIFWFHLLAFAAYVLLHEALVGPMLHYLQLFKTFTPLSGKAAAKYSLGYHEPVVSFFFNAVAAPSSNTTYAPWLEVPNYRGFFSPSLSSYLSNASSIFAMVMYLGVLSFVRPHRIDRLALGLLAFVVARFAIVVAFNPVEAILYSSVAILPYFAVLFAFVEKSEFPLKTPLAGLFAAALLLANLKFLT